MCYITDHFADLGLPGLIYDDDLFTTVFFLQRTRFLDHRLRKSYQECNENKQQDDTEYYHRAAKRSDRFVHNISRLRSDKYPPVLHFTVTHYLSGAHEIINDIACIASVVFLILSFKKADDLFFLRGRIVIIMHDKLVILIYQS